MRRHVGSHTYGNTGRSVYQQVGYTSREYCRLLLLIIVVGDEVDGVLVYVLHHLLADLSESNLSVTHGGRAVSVYGAEVSLSVNERRTHDPILCQTHKSTIY